MNEMVIKTELKRKKIFSLEDVSFFFLGLYILTFYIANDALIPSVLNSIALYSFLFFTLLTCVAYKKVGIPKFTLWYFGLILFCVFSFFYSTEPSYGGIYSMFVILVLSYCFFVNINSLKKIDIVANYYIFSSSTFTLGLLFTNQLFTNEEFGRNVRLGAEVSGNANTFSEMFMVSAIFCAWYICFRCNTKRKKILYFSIFLMDMFSMGLSGGRKTIIAVIVCTVIFYLNKGSSKFVSRIRGLIGAIVLIAILVTASLKIEMLYKVIGVRFESLFNTLFYGADASESDYHRIMYAKLAFWGWLKSPLWGNGFNNFRLYNQLHTGFLTYAHNNYLELLFDLGIIGFAYFYSYIVKLIKRLTNIKEFRDYKMLAVGLIIELLLYDMGGVSMFTNLPMLMLTICSIICSLTTSKQNN